MFFLKARNGLKFLKLWAAVQNLKSRTDTTPFPTDSKRLTVNNTPRKPSSKWKSINSRDMHLLEAPLPVLDLTRWSWATPTSRSRRKSSLPLWPPCLVTWLARRVTMIWTLLTLYKSIWEDTNLLLTALWLNKITNHLLILHPLLNSPKPITRMPLRSSNWIWMLLLNKTLMVPIKCSLTNLLPLLPLLNMLITSKFLNSPLSSPTKPTRTPWIKTCNLFSTKMSKKFLNSILLLLKTTTSNSKMPTNPNTLPSITNNTRLFMDKNNKPLLMLTTNNSSNNNNNNSNNLNNNNNNPIYLLLSAISMTITSKSILLLPPITATIPLAISTWKTGDSAKCNKPTMPLLPTITKLTTTILTPTPPLTNKPQVLAILTSTLPSTVSNKTTTLPEETVPWWMTLKDTTATNPTTTITSSLFPLPLKTMLTTLATIMLNLSTMRNNTEQFYLDQILSIYW